MGELAQVIPLRIVSDKDSNMFQISNLEEIGFTHSMIDHLFSAAKNNKFEFIHDDSWSMSLLGGSAGTRTAERDSSTKKGAISQSSPNPPSPQVSSKINGFKSCSRLEECCEFLKFFEPLGAKCTPMSDLKLTDKRITDHLSERYLQSRSSQETLVCVIVTDGEGPAAVEIENTIKILDGMTDSNMRIILRICTDNALTLNRWKLKLELKRPYFLDVVGNQVLEAKTIFRKYPWLVYGEPLHRMREIGLCDDLCNNLRSACLPHQNEIRLIRNRFATTNNDIFGCFVFFESWEKRVKRVAIAMENDASRIYCPVRKMFMPWIDIRILKLGRHVEYRY